MYVCVLRYCHPRDRQTTPNRVVCTAPRVCRVWGRVLAAVFPTSPSLTAYSTGMWRRSGVTYFHVTPVSGHCPNSALRTSVPFCLVCAIIQCTVLACNADFSLQRPMLFFLAMQERSQPVHWGWLEHILLQRADPCPRCVGQGLRELQGHKTLCGCHMRARACPRWQPSRGFKSSSAYISYRALCCQLVCGCLWRWLQATI
jgi:hypothetical protein